MPQVSKTNLRKDVSESVTHAFEKILTNIKDKDQAVAFMKALLTPTEKVMLPKRLAISLLIRQGKKYQEIKELLKVSQGTIAMVNRVMNQEPILAYNNLLDMLISDKQFRNVTSDLLGALIAPPLPPKGMNWGVWRKNQREEKQASQNRRKLPF